VAEPGYADAVLTEIQRSRRYLERTRLLDPMQTLDVLLVADAGTADSIVEQAQSRMPLDFHIVTPAQAASRFRIRRLPGDRLERLYIAEVLRRKPRLGYATSGETRYWTMTRVRRAIVATSVAASLVCATLAGALFSDGWMLKARTAAIERQVAQLSETLRREHENYSPIRADSHEMKLAVDTGDFLLANRLPVPWVMQQLGFVLGDFPDVRVRRLEWRAEEPVLQAVGGRRDATLPVVVPAVARVTAELTAEVVPFDGDMRGAFARVDALVAALESGTDFPQVSAIEYPLDARSDAAIAGDITARSGSDGARFRIRLVYPLAAAPQADGGAYDAT